MDWTATMHRLLAETTTVYRKGAPVIVEQVGDSAVVRFDNYPALPADQPLSEPPATLLDLHYVWVAVDTAAAEQRRPELLTLLGDYPDPASLARGPSYLALGIELDSQEAALRLIALGAALGVWALITPRTLGIEGAQADQMASDGYILCSGTRP
jgi:hypothetical protein